MAGPCLSSSVSLASYGLSSYPASYSFCPGEEHVPVQGEVQISLCVNRHLCVPVCKRICAGLVCAVGACGMFMAGAVDTKISQP